MRPETIRDLVTVHERPTVVRLDALDLDDPGWISETYHQTSEVGEHLQILRRLMAQEEGCGVFLIGHYGCGKSHFLAYLAQQLESGHFVDGSAPRTRTVSLVNFSSKMTLETIVAQTLGLDLAPDDRRRIWREVGQDSGLVLIIDELSEFLRAKPDRAAFTEDIRFLQFMGEWACGCRLWIVAAMQEQIEHTGALESALYRKIKDRYPIRLLLTPGHVRDLLSNSLLDKAPDYEKEVLKLGVRIRDALPAAASIAEDLPQLYPLHPTTLDLLEEVRDLFSQSRGVVDFVLTQLAGNSARDIQPFLDRPWGELLTPEYIVDHFADLFELQPEFLALAQRLLPYYRQHLHTLFESDAQRILAWRLIKLLMLVHISPRRESLDAGEAALWLLFRATSIDPDRNLQIVDRVLARLAGEGRYISERDGRYALDLRDDSKDRLDEMLRREIAEIQGATEEAVWEEMAPLLGDDGFNPFTLPRDRRQRRSIRWHFHERSYEVFFGNGTVKRTPTALGLCVRLPWGLPEPVSGMATVIPAALELTKELYELAALQRLRQKHADPRLRRLIDHRIGERAGHFGAMVHTAYLESQTVIDGVAAPISIRLEGRASVEKWLDAWAVWLLKKTFPSFERYAPAHGPLPREAARSLMRVAAEHDIGEWEGDEFVKLIREAYLAPMKLLTRDGWHYRTNPRLDANDLVRLVLPLAESGAPIEAVYEHLAEPVYGLVEDQIHLLLIFLLLEGQIDILKGGRSYRDLFETMPWPHQYDRLSAGRSLGIDQLGALETLCAGLRIRLSGSWTVERQRRICKQLQNRAQRERKRLFPLLERIRRLESGSDLGDRLERFLGWWAELEKGNTEIQAIEQFLFAVGSPEAFLTEVATMDELPQRLESIMGDLRRFRHLLVHPQVVNWPEATVAGRLEAVGEPPDLSEIESCNEWLSQARGAYESYSLDYRKCHDDWWQGFRDQVTDPWSPPVVAGSRHVGLGAQLEEMARCRTRLEALVCRGLSDLEFQPVCTCGFDGHSAPVLEVFERTEELRRTIEDRIRLFFLQDQVRESINRWNEEGIEVSQGTSRYVDGQADVPEIADLRLFDQHLAGVTLVQDVSGTDVLAAISGRSMAADDLLAQMERFLRRFGGKRIRVSAETRSGSGVGDQVVRWCVEQALRGAVALPSRLDLQDLNDAAEQLVPEWVGAAALDSLEDLGLGRSIENRVLEWIVDGQIPCPDDSDSFLVSSLAEVIRPSIQRTPESLAGLTGRLYRAHDRLRDIGGRRWLDRLGELAVTPLEPEVDGLLEVLRRHLGDQWLLVDCLGLALLDEGQEALMKLEPWQIKAIDFAQVGETTTTDACFRALAEEGINHPLIKVNAIDRLLHERRLPFADFCNLVRAELDIALGRMADQLDINRPVVVFADHGFRLGADGRGFSHGGASTLERVVPVFELVPR